MRNVKVIPQLAIRVPLVEKPDASALTFVHRKIMPKQDIDLTVYSASWCRDCREAKRFLETHKIPYKEIDIENTPGAADEVLRNVGKRAIPQFVLNGKWIQPYKPGEGFLYDEMSELLGVTQ